MKGLALMIVAFCLALVLLPCGFVYQLVSTLLKSCNSYLFTIAKSIDQMGNVVCARLFDLALIKKLDNPFGNEDETISSVLGKNKINNNLTWLGHLIAALLNKIEKEHVEKAIENVNPK